MKRLGPSLLESRPAITRLAVGRLSLPADLRRQLLARRPAAQLLGFSILPSGVIQDALDASYTNWDSSVKFNSPKFYIIGEMLSAFKGKDISDLSQLKEAAAKVSSKNKENSRAILTLALMMRDISKENFPSAWNMVHGGEIGLTSGITGSFAQTGHNVSTGAVNVAKETAADVMELAQTAAEKALNIGPWYMKPKLIIPLLLVGVGFYYWDKIKVLLPKKKAIQYAQNPVSKAEQAAELFEKFTEFPATKRKKIPAIDCSELADLGQALELGYKSNKWTGKQQAYLHEFGKSVRMYATPDGKTLVLTGGKMKITPRGIEN